MEEDRIREGGGRDYLNRKSVWPGVKEASKPRVERENNFEARSSTGRNSTVRFMLALVAQEIVEMLQIDVKAAFLNGNLERDIYMKQRDVYVSSKQPDFLYQLLRAIYGLKQASRAWHKICGNYLRQIGAKKSTAHSSLYMVFGNSDTVYILVYVDDMLLIGRSIKGLQKVAKLIGERFEILLEPSVPTFLGIIVARS